MPLKPAERRAAATVAAVLALGVAAAPCVSQTAAAGKDESAAAPVAPTSGHARIADRLRIVKQGESVALPGGVRFDLRVCNTLWGFCEFEIRRGAETRRIRMERNRPIRLSVDGIVFDYTLLQVPFQLLPRAEFAVDFVD